MDDSLPLYHDGALYDALFHNTRDIAYWKQQLKSWHAPVLEIGCGTGRLLLPLAEDGVDISGLDASADMLTVTRKKATAKGLSLQLYEHDMRQFDLSRSFATIIVPNNAFGHLYTRSDVEAHLACVKRNLHPEGVYMIDIFVPSPELLTDAAGQRSHFAEYVDPTTGITTHIYQKSTYDHKTQIKHATWIYQQEDRIIREEPFDMRMFFPQELDALLEYNQFEIINKFGDYDFTPFEYPSKHQLIVARLRE